MRNPKKSSKETPSTSCWAKKEDLYSFLFNEINRAEEVLNSHKKPSSNIKLQNTYNLLSKCDFTEAWNEKFASTFRGYNKSSHILDLNPKKWTALQRVSEIGELEDLNYSDGLNKSEKNFFNINGVLGPIKLNFFTSEDLSLLSSTFYHSGNKGNFFFKSKKIFNIAIHEEILRKVRSILGNDIVLLDDNIIVIHPHGHYDISHSDIQGGASLVGDEFFREDPGFLNVWISISGTDSLKAPLHFFPGTQNLGVAPTLLHVYLFRNYPERWYYYAKLLTFLEKSEYIERNHRLYLELLHMIFSKAFLQNYNRQEFYTKPGECIFFNAHVLHGSSANLSTEPRISIVLRYRKATAKPLDFGFPEKIIKDYLKDVGKNRKKEFHSKLNVPIVVQISGEKVHKDYFAINVDDLRKTLSFE